jgi:maltooligosyltrehalose trehalohydrolase
MCFFDPNTKNDQDNDILKEGDREKYWYKIQPYLIGLFTCRGIPLLWQGDEFCENYYVPSFGSGIKGRVELFRPLRWEKFYDTIGRTIRKLVRDSAGIHNANEEFRYGSYYFHNDYDQYQSKGLLVFEREYQNKYSLVILNFSNNDYTGIRIKFKNDGRYKEQLLGEVLPNIINGQDYYLKAPSNYGCVWTKV